MEIAEIKSNLKIFTVLEHYQLKPDSSHRLICPFHADTNPSLQIYYKTNTWHCFSSKCTAGSGDVIDFIMKKENLSKHDAIMKAKAMVGGEQARLPLSRKEEMGTDGN